MNHTSALISSSFRWKFERSSLLILFDCRNFFGTLTVGIQFHCSIVPILGKWHFLRIDIPVKISCTDTFVCFSVEFFVSNCNCGALAVIVFQCTVNANGAII